MFIVVAFFVLAKDECNDNARSELFSVDSVDC